MKALSLWQPWATLIAIGAKTIETRDWGTTYRGPLAIHATRNNPRDAQALVGTNDTFRRPLLEAGYLQANGRSPMFDLPVGAVVATCRLVDVVGCESARAEELLRERPIERLFGHYARGRWAYLLADVRRLEPPIPATGERGLWDWDAPAEVAL